MSGNDPLQPLRHMLDSAEEALSLIQGKTRKDLDDDRLLNLSLVRLLEIVGEAANRVSEEERLKYRSIPWQEIVGLRNRLIHGYDSVDMTIVWQILTRDLPPLVKELKRILGKA